MQTARHPCIDSVVVVSQSQLTYDGVRRRADVLAMLSIKIGLMGAGRMATALAQGLVRANIVPGERIIACDPSDDARGAFALAVPDAVIAADNRSDVALADVVVMAVKPQQMGEALGSIGSAIGCDALLVSIAAGVTLERLAASLPAGQRIVRVMPNMPCLIGRGVSGFALGKHATKSDAELVTLLLSAVGVAFEVPEKLLDAVTGLSGSGPAFVYSMIECLASGGAAEGLSPELALEMAARTVAGAAELVLQTGEAPAMLRDRVASPGGTTEAGLVVLRERGFNDAVVEAVRAATRRSVELGQSSK
ncbi:MAG TPA: pyrroline-5-carboxylate reductase [Lacipirellulaceae bacterium]|nr:pyrroline-5-carboxylate reductase [Lacipirellulaceae bacterium]